MSSFQAKVTSSTRRYIEICDPDSNLVLGKLGSRSFKVTVGDNVICEKQRDELIVTGVTKRKNILKRSYFGKEKELAANIDHLFIICAPGSIFNSFFIDRVLITSHSQSIPTTLIVNKIDQTKELEESNAQIQNYKKIGYNVELTSAKESLGLDPIFNVLSDDSISSVALTGVSGVGKTSLINAILPKALARIQEVSERTGQGRQTTSQSIAHLYVEGEKIKFIIDMPGVQKFGISHLSEDEVRAGFLEFAEISKKCKFSNCSHILEPKCAVLKGIINKEISQERYDSYLGIINEIKENEPY